METLLSTSITVPLFQIVLALVLGTIALLFGHIRMALFMIYCFVLYWSKPWNFQLYTETTPARLNGPECVFVAFCVITVLLAMMGLTFHRD